MRDLCIGVPDVIGDPFTVGHVDSDFKAGMIDYMMDASESIKPLDGIHLLLPSPLEMSCQLHV